ncbi:hypothetical protein ARZXY2_1639 [Arthrobacter sp. ZXY-2]|nr:hypothetical protein ARZXY2_1639 [Arthrobacter sp. ZXY-2]
MALSWGASAVTKRSLGCNEADTREGSEDGEGPVAGAEQAPSPLPIDAANPAMTGPAQRAFMVGLYPPLRLSAIDPKMSVPRGIVMI